MLAVSVADGIDINENPTVLKGARPCQRMHKERRPEEANQLHTTVCIHAPGKRECMAKDVRDAADDIDTGQKWVPRQGCPGKVISGKVTFTPGNRDKA